MPVQIKNAALNLLLLLTLLSNITSSCSCHTASSELKTEFLSSMSFSFTSDNQIIYKNFNFVSATSHRMTFDTLKKTTKPRRSTYSHRTCDGEDPLLSAEDAVRSSLFLETHHVSYNIHKSLKLNHFWLS